MNRLSKVEKDTPFLESGLLVIGSEALCSSAAQLAREVDLGHGGKCDGGGAIAARVLDTTDSSLVALGSGLLEVGVVVLVGRFGTVIGTEEIK